MKVLCTGIKMLHIENSVMLCFGMARLMFEMQDPPTRELKSTSGGNIPTAQWAFGIIILLIKNILSGYGTFKFILLNEKVRSYVVTRQPPSMITFALVSLKVLFEIIFAGGTTFLVRSKKFCLMTKIII